MSDKIKPHHRSRKAMLYVRQSSPNQVLRNQESTRLQYGMRKRLLDFGWQHIEVVDDDLGKSAAESARRPGFQRLVADVCMGSVGAVAAREMSRFARNSKDWQQLIEVCRVVDTVLIDHETVYDPRLGNDRLLLGLKGSLNEYELDILRLRSVEARREKARRGELIVSAPVGYAKTADCRLELAADKRVQEAIRLVFKKMLECGAARQVLLWMIEHGIDMPARHRGPLGWELVWRRPTYQMIISMLKNPIYAGFYTYGKTEAVVVLEEGVARKRMRRKPKDKWLALLPDHHEAYIECSDFERIQELMARNAQKYSGTSPGAPKKGNALLAGIVRCSRCGKKLMVKYSGSKRTVPRYMCNRGHLDSGEPKCISVGALDIDDSVSTELLRVVEPAAVEAALRAGREAYAKQDDSVRALEFELEAARYNVEKSWKQYDAVDPQNRHVAGQLELRWNSALEHVRKIEMRIDEEKERLAQTRPPDPEALGDLARDLNGIWNDACTDVRLKKRIVRTIIKEVILDVDVAVREVKLSVHWQGGVHTELRVHQRMRGQTRNASSVEAIEAIGALALVCSDEMIAGYLTRNGLKTGKGNRWTLGTVTSARNKRGIRKYSPSRKQSEGWMTLTDAANHVNLSNGGLKAAAERGEIPVLRPLENGPWIFRRQDLDSEAGHLAVERVRMRKRGGRPRNPDQLSLL